MSSSRSAEVLQTSTPQLFQTAVRRAAELLKVGEIVALPTETVYGLAGNAFDAQAVSRIFAIKGRPAHNPIIVHVANFALARECVACWPALADKLATAFWPGPLTLVLPRSESVPDVVTAGGTTVGIRWPSHPFIQAVISECGFPLAAPSANSAGYVSSTKAEHVRKYFGDQIPLIVDGGPSQIGIESTVLDLSVSPPRLLRPGMIHELALNAVIDESVLTFAGSEPFLKSPGLLPKHYAPRAKLAILSWKDGAELRRQIKTDLPPGIRCHVIAHTHIPSVEGFARVAVIPHDAEAFARAIYAELHACDEAGAECILVEKPPETGEWRAILDRLTRAAAK